MTNHRKPDEIKDWLDNWHNTIARWQVTLRHSQ
jgi:hypothetical protein